MSNVEAHLKAAHAGQPHAGSLSDEISDQGFQAEGLVVDMGQPVIGQLRQCHRDIAGTDAARFASTATTDLRFFHRYGQIPSTCYGPVGAAIHGIDEWVSISSLQQLTAVLALFIARWCGLNRRAV